MEKTKKVRFISDPYLFIGGIMLSWGTGDGGMSCYLYDEMGSPIGLACRESTNAKPILEKYFFTKNLQGDIIGIVNEAGELVVEYTYDAWGKCTETIHPTTDFYVAELNPFRYRGYYYDEESGYYYLNSRYYDPQTKRFLNADDIGYLGANGDLQSFNLFAYCSNNPVNYKRESVYSSDSIAHSYISSMLTDRIYNFCDISSCENVSARVNWGNGGFIIPIWISSLMSESDFGASVAPTLRTIYQYIRYPGVKDLNKLYGLDHVPGKLNTVSSVIGYGLLGVNIGLSAWSNFTNDNLTTKQQWISFGVDTTYTLGTFGIGYGVGALVSLIPVIGVFAAPFSSAGVTWFVDWANEKWGWLDEIKQWFNDL